MCIRATLNKKLTANLMRMRKQAFAICFNDIKSCFDRIVHWVSTLALQCLGVPKNTVLCIFQIIQKACHKIGTAYGMPKNTYSGDRRNPIKGTSQGSICNPPWITKYLPEMLTRWWLDKNLSRFHIGNTSHSVLPN